MDPKTIIDALRNLDPADDTHWTEGGAPVIEKVAELLGVKTSELKRADITNAAPDCNRTDFNAWVEQLDEIAQEERQAAEERTTIGRELTGEDALREEFNERIRALEADQANNVKALDAAQRNVNETQRKIDDLINERERALPKKSPVDALKAHLNANLQRRMDAAMERQGRATSPLDQSLSGRKRSETRPAVAAKK